MATPLSLLGGLAKAVTDAIKAATSTRTVAKENEIKTSPLTKDSLPPTGASPSENSKGSSTQARRVSSDSSPKEEAMVEAYLLKTSPIQSLDNFSRQGPKDKINYLNGVYTHYKEGRGIKNKLFENSHHSDPLDMNLKTQKSSIDSTKDFLRNLLMDQYKALGKTIDKSSVRSFDSISLVKLVYENNLRNQNNKEIVSADLISKNAPNHRLEKLKQIASKGSLEMNFEKTMKMQ